MDLHTVIHPHLTNFKVLYLMAKIISYEYIDQITISYFGEREINYSYFCIEHYMQMIPCFFGMYKNAKQTQFWIMMLIENDLSDEQVRPW